MGPAKFGDIAKGATEVLNDDYQVDGHQFKSKLNTTFDGASATAAIDLWPPAKADSKSEKEIQTPAKITWKFPKPMGIAGVSVDKLEMSKSGDFAAEFAFTEKAHAIKDLSLSAKTDLVNVSKATVGATFTGIADTRLQLETKPLNPVDFTFEVTRTIQQLTVGAKLSKKDMTPQAGINFSSGSIFAALLASDKLKKYQAYAMYKVNKDMKLAGTCEYATASGGSKLSAGIVYDAGCHGKYKAKVTQEGVASCSHKYQISKGFTCLMGAKYNWVKPGMTWGCQISVE